MKVAYIADSPFTRYLHQAFANANPDMEILAYSTNGTFWLTKIIELKNGGGADVEFKPKEKLL